ncbi:MAG: ABC transporter permease, partial [Anaerolineae bacterium]|nr:ABC transporter permease [Anaerolineae bacterium]
MLKYVLTRAGAALPQLLAVSALVFLLVYAMPGGVAAALLGEDATPDSVAALETKLGLQDPLPVQYGRWLVGVVQGDLGESWSLKEPVAAILADRVPVTLSIAVGGMGIGIALGVFVGSLSGLRPGSWLDRLLALMASLGVAMPAFWVAMLLALYFAVQLGWFPAIGYTPPAKSLV